MKIKKIFRNLSYSVLANGVNTLVSMILVLFVPKILGVREYSYWQLYLFYASYVGFFHFGWADGIYLRFGGRRYEDLDKEYFNRQFWLLVIVEVVLAGFFVLISCFMMDINKRYIISAVGICCVLQLPRTLLQYVLQTTNRIVSYAKNYLLEKIVYAILVVAFLLCGIRNFEVLVLADLIARACTLFLLICECGDIVFIKMREFRKGIVEAWTNISVGIKLMFANIASQLLLGIVRWAIQNHWTVETFGKVSLSITASNLLMVFISAVSVVLYPMLKNVSEEKYASIYIQMRNLLMVTVLGLLLVYYPAKEVLSWWLPQYEDSLKFMALLFPMFIFESKMTLLVNTYLKVLRKEKTIMYINWGVVAVTLVSTIIFVYVCNNLVMAIASLPILLGIRSGVGELLLGQYLNCRLKIDMMVEWAVVIVFMLTNWFIDSWLVFAVYGVIYMFYVLWKKATITEWIEMLFKN